MPAIRMKIPRQFLVALLIALCVLVPLSRGFEKPGTVMDEGAVLVYPELILKGQLPYRDFETFYGPGNLYVLAASYSVFGINIFVERTVGLCYRLLVLIAVFLIARPYGTVIAAGCMAVCGFLLVPTGLGAFAWIGGLACLLWSLCLTAKPESGRRALGGGLMAGFALLFRPDLVLAVVFSAFPLFLALPRPGKWKYLIGLISGGLPMLLLAVAVGWEPIYNNLLLFPVFIGSSGRHLPVLSAEEYLVFLLVLHIVASLVNVAAGWIAMRANPREIGPRLLLGSALLGAGLTHQVVQRLDLMHVLAAAIVSLGLLPLSLHACFSFAKTAPARPWTPYLGILIVFALIGVSAPPLLARVRHEVISSLSPGSGLPAFLEEGDRSFPLGALDRVRAAGRILDDLARSSRAGERLFVGPSDLRRTNYNNTFFYHLMPQLPPATYFLEMNPLSANRPNSRLAADVERADWLVLDQALDNWAEPNRSMEFGSDAPNAVVRDHFELAKQSGTYLLYRRKKPANP
jgi:hypothetical protein